MVSVLVIWGYMIFTCYIIGYAVLWQTAEKQGYCIKWKSSYLYAGIAAVTAYAQTFSIFCKVGGFANALLLITCICCILRFRKEFYRQFQDVKERVTPAKAAAVVLLFLLFAYGTSAGTIHYDTSLYHAQSIRWIEEYGVVSGLGNLHNRLAYNSASFALSALYSFAFLGGQSYHCCAGFMAFLLAAACVGKCSKYRLKNPRLSDFARITGLFYLVTIYDEMVSPASDYFMVLSTFYIIIRWLDLLEENEKSYIPYALLCVMAVFTVTVKLSGVMLLLLAVKPLCQMIKERKGRHILNFTGMGLASALPFFIRNVIISGWLVYPVTFIDWFNTDYKMPKGLADYDAMEIKAYARGYPEAVGQDISAAEWLPRWASSLNMINKLFLMLAFAGMLLFLAYCIYAVIRKKSEMADSLFVMGVIGGGGYILPCQCAAD